MSNVLRSSLDGENDLCIQKTTNQSALSMAIASAVVGNCNRDPRLQNLFVITPKGQVLSFYLSEIVGPFIFSLFR